MAANICDDGRRAQAYTYKIKNRMEHRSAEDKNWNGNIYVAKSTNFGQLALGACPTVYWLVAYVLLAYNCNK